MGGIFPEPPSRSERPDSSPLTRPNTVLSASAFSALIPPSHIIERLHAEKRICVDRATLLLILEAVAAKASDEDVLRMAGRDSATLTMLGTMLVRHSKDGAWLGRRVFEIAIRKGDQNAEFQLAQVLCEDLPPDSPKDIPRALQILRSLAGRNHAQAQYALGMRYVSTGSDVHGGIALLERAAKNDHPSAWTQLGHVYSKGISGAVKPNPALAHKHLVKGHEHGLPEATFLLAQHPSTHPDDALKYTKEAAHKGLAIAQHNIGSHFFEKGDALGAKEYWEMSAVQGLQLAQLNLATLLREGGTGVAKDKKQAMRWMDDCVARGGPVGEAAEERRKEWIEEDKKAGSGTGCSVM
ncbi:hypothetical protein HKX48_004252 [Thoreauomyces humboldtii]|nr:hypothetical protein HKX48_004252 [Thoreauomyces humboldtii]